MRKLGLMQELISLLQGRVDRIVFTQFYLKENLKELTDKTISLLGNLENDLINLIREELAVLGIAFILRRKEYISSIQTYGIQ